MLNLKDKIFNIPDYPKKGIIFRDITPILLEPDYFALAISMMCEKIKKLPVDLILGIESRGFIFGGVLANKLGVGFVPVRKTNKLLPRKTVEQTYSLEYGSDGVKIHADAILPNQRVIIVDDLVATAGTALATARLVEKCRGKILAFLFLTELTYLKPREKLAPHKVISLVKF